MQPENKRPTGPIIPARQYLNPQDDKRVAAHKNANHEVAAANIVRGQIEKIYDQDPNSTMAETEPADTPEITETPDEPITIDHLRESGQQKTENPYDRTHSSKSQITDDQWRDYHSAWQDYYQQYYHRYYIGQMYHAQQQLKSGDAKEKIETTDQEPLTDEQAVSKLKSELLDKIRTSAKRVKSSKHFVPAIAGVCVMLVFLFLQYNSMIFAYVAAYISPSSVTPSSIIAQPNGSIVVGPESKIYIPKIRVDANVIYDTTPDQVSQLKAMEKGVAWFGITGANSKPGQVGNTVLSGHSSNDWLESGDNKFVFARLEQLQLGDMIYLHYNTTRYSYTITKREVVKPTEINKLVYETDRPVLTLITCTPLGTAEKRLLLTAEQISPDPAKAATAPDSTDTPKTNNIPGSAPTFFERLFGRS